MIIDPLNADDAELLRNLKDDNDLLHALGELPTDQSEEAEPPLTDRQFHVLTELYRNARLFGFPERELARRLGMDESELRRTLVELAELGAIEMVPGGESV